MQLLLFPALLFLAGVLCLQGCNGDDDQAGAGGGQAASGIQVLAPQQVNP